MIADVVDGLLGAHNWRAFANALKEAQGVILYHGTSSVFLDSIKTRGLLPRSMTGNSVYQGQTFGGRNLESKPDLVYLIHQNRIGFGGFRAVNRYGGDLIALRVFIPECSMLVPDEDSRKRTWHESVAWEDSCAHRGPVPPAQLLGYIERTGIGIAKDQVRYTAWRPDPDSVVPLDGVAISLGSR